MSDDEERRPSESVSGVDWGTGNSVSLPPLVVGGSPTPEQMRHFQEEAERYQQSLFEGFRMPAEMFQADSVQVTAIDADGNPVDVEIAEETLANNPEVRTYAELDAAVTAELARRHRPDTMIVPRAQYEEEMRVAMLRTIQEDMDRDFQAHSLQQAPSAEHINMSVTSHATAVPCSCNANGDQVPDLDLSDIYRIPSHVSHVNKESDMAGPSYTSARIPLPHLPNDDDSDVGFAADLNEFAEKILEHVQRPLTAPATVDGILDTLACRINCTAAELIGLNFDLEEDDTLGTESAGKDELHIILQATVALCRLLGYNDVLSLALATSNKLARVTGLDEEEEEED